MSLHRAGLMAITTLITAGLTSVAFAGCCDWGMSAAPAAYASPVGYAASGCGACGPAAYAAPVAYARTGCGGCGAAVYSAPFAYGTGCGGCGRGVTLIAPSPIYVVDQGPHYSGPAIMTYKTYATGGYAGAYPYVYPLGAPYTGYDGGPYANPVDYRPSVYVAPRVGVAPAARIIHRYVGPRAVKVRVHGHAVVPGAKYYYRNVKVRG